MGRAPCCDKANVKRGPWSPEEDTTLKNYVETYGSGGNWIALPHKAGLKRCGKSCRLRWLNYLRPDIKHGGFTEEEDNIICSLYNSIGSRWSVIASRLPGRTDNDVKNYWNTKLKKKLFAGKTSRDINNNNSIATNNNIHLSSTTSSPASLTKAEADSIQACVDSSSTELPLSSEVGFGQNMDSQRRVPSQIHFPLPGLIDTSMDNSYSVSSSQEASGISVSASCSLALANNYVSWSGNGGGEDYGLSMDFGFGSPYDLFSGFGFQEKSSEAVPNLANSLYADHLLADGSDTKPSGLYRSIIN